MFRCTVFGHRFRFAADGNVMRWQCARDCGASGLKIYPTGEDAARYARALDREDAASLGRRAPLVGLFPLRLFRILRDRRRRGQALSNNP